MDGATAGDNVEKLQQSVAWRAKKNLAVGLWGVLRWCICILQLKCILSCLWHTIIVAGKCEEREDGGGGLHVVLFLR